ncbi:hypothetical protein E4U54_005131 [Claviceps lovelessii]|nr:hypothetical protein E4U54_005131 [Claviceps lovelessii]
MRPSTAHLITVSRIPSITSPLSSTMREEVPPTSRVVIPGAQDQAIEIVRLTLVVLRSAIARGETVLGAMDIVVEHMKETMELLRFLDGQMRMFHDALVDGARGDGDEGDAAQDNGE